MSTRRPRVPRAAVPAREHTRGTSGGGVSQQKTPQPETTRPEVSRDASAAPSTAAETQHPETGRILRPDFQRHQPVMAFSETVQPAAEAPAVEPFVEPAGSPVADRADEAATPVPVPARAFSGRLLALAVVLLAVTLFLAPSVRTYLQQQTEISQLQTEISEHRRTQAELKSQLARWDDPAYIRQQARDRLFLVMPGETRYLVIGAESAAASKPPATSAEAVKTDLPWVDALWDSVKRSATD